MTLRYSWTMLTAFAGLVSGETGALGQCTSSWSRSIGSPGMNDTVYVLASWGSNMYAGGFFTSAGGKAANHVAAWDGSSWQSLGTGVDDIVFAMVVWDDGTGPALYVGGNFVNAGGLRVNHIAKWNGSAWSEVGSGLDAAVWSLAAYNGELYAGGLFTAAGELETSRIAKWDGKQWSAVGGGVAGDESCGVDALTVFDDGSGPALYAGGHFSTAGGNPASNIARWSGQSWQALGAGVHALDEDDWVRAMCGYSEPGKCPSLFVAGQFDGAGEVPASNIARWDGSAWSDVGVGVNSRVIECVVYNDGSGAALYVGGLFTMAGGAPANKLALWNGENWREVSHGLNADVDGLLVHTVPSGGNSVLYVGGAFTSAGGHDATRIARYPAENCPSDTDGSGKVDIGDLLDLISNWGTCP